MYAEQVLSLIPNIFHISSLYPLQSIGSNLHHSSDPYGRSGETNESYKCKAILSVRYPIEAHFCIPENQHFVSLPVVWPHVL